MDSRPPEACKDYAVLGISKTHSLQYPGCTSTVWQDMGCPLTIKKATIKAMLLTQRYPLSTSRTAGSRRSELCPLCNSEPETTTHFLLQCGKLSTVRYPYLKRIMDTCRTQRVSVDPVTITQIVLDTNHLPIPSPLHERICRDFTFKLHDKRTLLLGGESAYINRHRSG